LLRYFVILFQVQGLQSVMTVNGQPIGICSALVLAYFTVLNWHLSKKKPKENKGKLSRW